MTVEEHISLAPLTSFGVGGPAERLVTLETVDELPDALNSLSPPPGIALGYGSNVLIADNGLPGTTLLLRNDLFSIEGTEVTAGAGTIWDALVEEAVRQGLWGVELMSGIPGSVGAGAFININAYGQGFSDVVSWIEFWNSATQEITRLTGKEMPWSYKHSMFQEKDNAHLVIVRVGLSLSQTQTTPLTYQSALDAAESLRLNVDELSDRRRIILEARERAGSLFVPGQGHARTVGSFFRNPFVTPKQAERVVAFDESGKTRQQIEEMNRVHGGDTLRVSAAHVLLAAGFSRGQMFGNVKLHDQHVLKIENAGGATAQEIYDVAQLIMRTTKETLGITLEPEARILGDFT